MCACREGINPPQALDGLPRRAKLSLAVGSCASRGSNPVPRSSATGSSRTTGGATPRPGLPWGLRCAPEGQGSLSVFPRLLYFAEQPARVFRPLQKPDQSGDSQGQSFLRA